ncbi:YlbF family regulator [Methanolacinia paynteri]|uniref:YlbF family regulator n=1 Tax=Methanolacinia paynteri TaxID=230356 RepID=UPI00064EE5B5|nr:YlbF family regulator [Methanolacinia paynteri]
MKEESKISPELLERINAFGNAILESSEYRALIQCNERLDKDQNAQDLFRQYRLKQQALQLTGFDRTILGELNDLEAQMKSNETLASLENSQKELVGLFKSSNNLISSKIDQPFAQKRGGCY